MAFTWAWSYLIGLAFFSLNAHGLNFTIVHYFMSAVIPFTMHIFLDFDQLHIYNIIHATLISFDDHINILRYLR